jgi:signal transduction histidine kinase
MTNDLLTESQLGRLLEVGRSLVTQLDIEVLLNEVLEAAKELTGARYAALGILDEEKSSLERFINLGVDEPTRKAIGPLPQGRGVLGELIRHPEPLRLKRVGDHPRSYGFPPGHPPMDSFVGVPIRVRGEAFGNIYLTEKDGGGTFDERDEAMLVVLADWAAVAIDNARIHERSEQRAIHLERAVQALEATVSLSRAGTVEADLDSLVELIVKRGRALIECRTLFLVSTKGRGMNVVAVAGENDVLPGQEIRNHHEALDAALSDGRIHQAHGTMLDLERAGMVESDSGLVVHLDHRGKSQGFLIALGARDGHGYSADDELLFQSFASTAATSIASARNVEQERLRMAIDASEQEKRRWAMELHDETLQDLGALKVMHESHLARGDPETMRNSLEQASGQLDRTIASLESLIHELRPATLDVLGVSAAVETLVERTCARGRIDGTTHIDLQDGRLSPQLESTVYRVVQEALNNTVKHADASRASVAITEANGEVTIFVEDDGSGFDPSQGFGDRFGLHGMRERVELVNGQMEIDSLPGRGTRIEAHLPVTRGPGP